LTAEFCRVSISCGESSVMLFKKLSAIVNCDAPDPQAAGC
jgi:hypothetical protein